MSRRIGWALDCSAIVFVAGDLPSIRKFRDRGFRLSAAEHGAESASCRRAGADYLLLKTDIRAEPLNVCTNSGCHPSRLAMTATGPPPSGP